MNLKLIEDLANDSAEEFGKYIFNIMLPPRQLMAVQYQIDKLDWHSISYGEEGLSKIPDDKRGIYAFAICYRNDVLPPHGYILYIGIAGRNSYRSLRERYKDYLNERKVRKRSRILRMIGNWHEVLRFYFAPIDDDISSEDLKKMEQQLISALLPPFSVGDLDAETGRKVRAFR